MSVATHGSGVVDKPKLNDVIYLDTFWDDIAGSLSGRQLSSTAGKVDYNWAESAITFQSGGDIDADNDVVVFSVQSPHAAKSGSSLHFHIHWEQTSTNVIEFTFQYRVQSNGAAKTTAWQTVVVTSASNAFPYVSGTLNQITALATIPITGLSDVVQCRFARTDATAGDIIATFIDAHFEKDTPGSREQYTK